MFFGMFLSKIWTFIKGITSSTWVKFSALGWKTKTAIIIALLALISGALWLLGDKELPEVVEVGPRVVEVKSVAELAGGTSLNLAGTVNAQSQASVRAEKSGQVTAVYRSLGDTVAAGTIVAEIESASERAAVLQAQGSVDAAQANLDKVRNGTREQDLAVLQSAKTSAEASFSSAKSSSVTTILSASAVADSAIRGSADDMFSNPESVAPQFNVKVSNTQLKTNLENGRINLKAVLSRLSSRSSSVSVTSDLSGELTATEADLRTVRNFLDTLVEALNGGISSPGISEADIAAFKASASSARTSVTTSLSSVSTAKENLAARASALQIAEKNLEQGVEGARPEDIAAAQASLKQTQGVLAGARAQLEKALIRAPISGVINSFSLKRGDYAQISSVVLVVANNNALEVVTYITEDDSREISVGTEVTMDNGAKGVITKIAPAIDPLTKKIEVRIGISDEASLVNGQSVVVNLPRIGVAEAAAPVRITIPLSSLKVGANETVVFTVDESNTLVAHPVTLGTLLGDRVVILSGVTVDMRIVVDARGLREGQVVEVR